MKSKGPGKTIIDKGRQVVSMIEGKNGAKLVLKIRWGKGHYSEICMMREKVALSFLKGLAVPKRVFVKRPIIDKMVKDKDYSYVVLNWLPWRDCYNRKFTTPQALALWIFSLEQFCAFRRRQILYTDIKSSHLLVSDDLTQARLIDFDFAVMLEPDGLYETKWTGFTFTEGAPEYPLVKNITERAIVYQMGMLLGALVLKSFVNTDRGPKPFKRMRAKLAKCGVREVFEIFKSAISLRPSERQKDLEVLFNQILSVPLPPTTYKIWRRLRAPYDSELSKLGFEDPNSFVKQPYRNAA